MNGALVGNNNPWQSWSWCDDFRKEQKKLSEGVNMGVMLFFSFRFPNFRFRRCFFVFIFFHLRRNKIRPERDAHIFGVSLKDGKRAKQQKRKR